MNDPLLIAEISLIFPGMVSVGLRRELPGPKGPAVSTSRGAQDLLFTSHPEDNLVQENSHSVSVAALAATAPAAVRPPERKLLVRSQKV